MDHCPPSTLTSEKLPPGSGSMRRLVRHLDLFSGIGGFALAAKMVGGIETVGFCEINPYAVKVLKKNFPGVPIHNDVRNLKPSDYGTIELITGGYACQPFSLAGKREGEDDDRHLWPAMRRIIEDARPRMVLCENVVGHVTLGLDTVLSELESIGYSCGATVLPACAVDARHRRDRVWILAHSESKRERGNQTATIKGGRPIKGDTESVHALEEVLADASERQSRQGPSWNAISATTGRDWKATVFGDGGERSEWCAEPNVGRVANGIPDRLDRLHGLGNAIVPQVAAEILRCMMAVDCMSNDKIQP